MIMLKQTSAVALLLTTFGIAVAISPGCGSDSPSRPGTAGAGGGTAGAGTAGAGTAGEGTAGAGTAGTIGGTAGAGTAGAAGGTAGAGTAGAGTAGAGTAGAAGAPPPVITAGPAVIEIDDVIVSQKSTGADGGVDGASDGGVDGAIASDGGVDGAVTSDGGVDGSADGGASDGPIGAPATGVSYTFDTTAQGWKYSPYGSTPNNAPTDPTNLAITSTLAWSATDDADGHSTSGVLKGNVQFKYQGDRIDFQAFTNPMAQYNWTGFVVTAKVKLVSGGNLAYGCPLEAYIYVSDADGSYNTKTSVPVNLVTGGWVTVTFDLADAAAQGLDIAKANQLGLQMDTGPACVGTTPPDAGTDTAPTDGGTTDAPVDAPASDVAADTAAGN
jgi:hypothetical protein